MIETRGSPRKRVRVSPRSSNSPTADSLSPSSRGSNSETQNFARNGITNRVSVNKKAPKNSKKKQSNLVSKTQKVGSKNGNKQVSKQVLKEIRSKDESEIISDEDIVFWTRAGSRTFWPARRCTKEEREALEGVQKDSVGRKKDNRVSVFYFGSQDVGYVSKTNILPFEKYFSKFHKKNDSRPFNMALEIAKGEILKMKNEQKEEYECPICGEASETQNADKVLICDRCHDEVHMTCLRPPVTKVPEGEWFCPRCEEDAPLTLSAARQAEE
eukprot:CAMPEP_0204841006 /NCGR_PEP_ID=MMETSP1346-20131115/40047_1 /ASSEMBLY_ACC=CAM_ASM_000771 /TAXON_ID=215587 /ORGANISM="Aplanochytrium stocchinoi, Strain GSBS06" /LENGTH=270 /DNA_ID=CAMNT_0051978815 /DNA_START=86 /DNA_END=895 /DNA_ORIENTATION=-